MSDGSPPRRSGTCGQAPLADGADGAAAVLPASSGLHPLWWCVIMRKGALATRVDRRAAQDIDRTRSHATHGASTAPYAWLREA
jgi:hypothetical protein